MSRLETRVEKLEAQTDDPGREQIILIWERDREPEPGELVISWLREGLRDEPISAG